MPSPTAATCSCRALVAVLLLAFGPACVAPRERGWAPPVLPAHAALQPVGSASGEGLVLLVEGEQGVLLRVLASGLVPGEYELVLGHDDARGWQPEPIGSFQAGANGRGGLELELEDETLAAGSRLLGRTVALIGRGGVLRGLVDKGVEVQKAPPAAGGPQPSATRQAPAARESQPRG